MVEEQPLLLLPALVLPGLPRLQPRQLVHEEGLAGQVGPPRQRLALLLVEVLALRVPAGIGIRPSHLGPNQRRVAHADHVRARDDAQETGETADGLLNLTFRVDSRQRETCTDRIPGGN